MRVDQLLVQLSSPEYLLLQRLDEQRNNWVPSSELWSALGHEVTRPHDSSLLRMHALRVRRKLGPWRFVLRTERGKGTMLSDLPDTSQAAEPDLRSDARRERK
jgi:hypothetical protein